jgi:hypothetical protein
MKSLGKGSRRGVTETKDKPGVTKIKKIKAWQTNLVIKQKQIQKAEQLRSCF